MKCHNAICSNRGTRINLGWCDACSFDIECGLDRTRDEARSCAKATGKPWMVVEAHPTSKVYQRAKRLGRTAYGAYPASYQQAMLAAGYTILETVEAP